MLAFKNSQNVELLSGYSKFTEERLMLVFQPMGCINEINDGLLIRVLKFMLLNLVFYFHLQWIELVLDDSCFSMNGSKVFKLIIGK